MSLEYRSTRGQDLKRYQFTDVLLASTAKDGGLLVPESLPHFSQDDFSRLTALSYAERVQYVFNAFQPNLTLDAIVSDTKRAYAQNFDSPDITPIVTIKPNQHVQELWHGPTSAFKDMALQVMPLLATRAAGQENEKLQEEGESPVSYLVLTATSGDTGKAALEGYKDVPGFSIIVFYPDGRVSALQELQMSTQEGNNVAVHAMRGDFDDVQGAVKEVFGDEEFRELLKKENIVLSSANSINWGRILPQIAYHISGYVELMRTGEINPGAKINIAVPTGNFGNLLAAFYAKQMGLPVDKLICASNENNVLTEFLRTGVYDINSRNLIQTPSPSMDILVASNVERLLYAITDDSQQVSRWIDELKRNGRFTVDNKTAERLKQEFYADWVSNKDCLINIKNVADRTGYLMDPHTSVAQAVAERYLEQVEEPLPTVICSTAHWAKFAKDVYRALTDDSALPAEVDEFTAIEQIKVLVPNVYEPKNIANLTGKPVLHTIIFDATSQGVKDAVLSYLKGKGQERQEI